MVYKETRQAFEAATKLRAKAYVYFYEEIAGELGNKKAKELCSLVTYRLGQDKALEIPEESKKSALTLAHFFISDPVGRIVFNQQVLSGNKDEAIIEMKKCPLVSIWKTMKLKDEMICTLCDFAHKIDYGTIQGAGFNLEFKGRIACGNNSCILRIYEPVAENNI